MVDENILKELRKSYKAAEKVMLDSLEKMPDENKTLRDLNEAWLVLWGAYRVFLSAINAARWAVADNSDGNLEETSEWIAYNAASAAYYKAYDDYVENRDKGKDND